MRLNRPNDQQPFSEEPAYKLKLPSKKASHNVRKLNGFYGQWCQWKNINVISRNNKTCSDRMFNTMKKYLVITKFQQEFSPPFCLRLNVAKMYFRLRKSLCYFRREGRGCGTCPFWNAKKRSINAVEKSCRSIIINPINQTSSMEKFSKVKELIAGAEVDADKFLQ